MSLFIYDMIVYEENPKESIKKKTYGPNKLMSCNLV